MVVIAKGYIVIVPFPHNRTFNPLEGGTVLHPHQRVVHVATQHINGFVFGPIDIAGEKKAGETRRKHGRIVQLVAKSPVDMCRPHRPVAHPTLDRVRRRRALMEYDLGAFYRQLRRVILGLSRVFYSFGRNKLEVHAAVGRHEKGLLVVDRAQIPDTVIARLVVAVGGIVADDQRQFLGLHAMRGHRSQLCAKGKVPS